MDAHNENFYISSELSEVIDLVIKRQGLLQHIDIIGNDKMFQDSNYDLIVKDFYRITAKLEKLVVKHEIALDDSNINLA